MSEQGRTQRVLVIGASGLIGSAVADALQSTGHEVIRASRSSAETVDLGDPASIEDLFARVRAVDAVIAAVGSVPFKTLDALTVDDFRSGFENKALGQIRLAAAAVPHLRDGGSITLTTGVLAERPVPTGAAASVANAALHGYVLAAAPSLPRGLRINAVSPNVLLEATGYHASFPGFVPVPAADVARSYVDVVEGESTGQVVSV